MNSKNERRVSLLEGPEPGPVVPLDTWDASHRLGCQCRHLLGTRHRATRFSLDDATTQCGGWTWLPSLLRGRGTEQVPAQPTQQSRSWDLKQAIGGYFILIGPSRSRAARLDQSARPGGQKTRASEERGASAREEPGGPPPIESLHCHPLRPSREGLPPRRTLFSAWNHHGAQVLGGAWHTVWPPPTVLLGR